jgi:hypothetical protein
MSKLKAEIVHDAKNVVFYPSPNRVTYLNDPDSPLLKRLAPKGPKRPPRKPPQPEQDDNDE